jgi:hypothetical protein
MTELGFKAIAFICLTALGIAVLFAFTEPTAKWAFGSILGIMAALLGVPALISFIRRSKQ